jgi:membrane carboxypeptidase/penicillin-binding protein
LISNGGKNVHFQEWNIFVIKDRERDVIKDHERDVINDRERDVIKDRERDEKVWKNFKIYFKIIYCIISIKNYRKYY